MNAQPAPEAADLARLSDAWQQFGCAICAHVPTPYAPEGARIELDHILSRAQGGDDSEANLMGLCGELCENKCHWRKHQGLLRIRWAENVNSWVWSDDAGVTGICRRLDRDLIIEAGQDQSLVLSRKAIANTDYLGNSEVPEEYLPPEFPKGHGAKEAEQRFMLIRATYREMEQRWMQVALLVQYSLSVNDPAMLGFDRAAEWADAIGIGQAQLSKLRLVGKIFQGAWTELPAQDRAQLSQEGLYVAARMVYQGRWEAERALKEAVAHPVSYLYSMYKNDHSVEPCVCEKCGKQHWPHMNRKKEAAPG